MRLFFALWPPIEIAERLAEIARSAANNFGGKPTREETIHLTLAFIGDVPDDRLPLLIGSARGIRTAPFDLDIDGLGYWRHNHLIWASILPSAALTELASTLKNALTEVGFANGREKHAFAPHVSLVRKVPESSVPLTLPVIEPARWHCPSFVLVRSRLADAPPFYETVSEFPLS